VKALAKAGDGTDQDGTVEFAHELLNSPSKQMALRTGKILKIRIGFCLALIQRRIDARDFSRVPLLLDSTRVIVLPMGAGLLG
jgi:hypothetical protein